MSKLAQTLKIKIPAETFTKKMTARLEQIQKEAKIQGLNFLTVKMKKRMNIMKKLQKIILIEKIKIMIAKKRVKKNI